MLEDKEKDYYQNMLLMEIFGDIKTLCMHYPLIEKCPEDFIRQFRAFTTIFRKFIGDYNTVTSGLLPDHIKNDEFLKEEYEEWQKYLQ